MNCLISSLNTTVLQKFSRLRSAVNDVDVEIVKYRRKISRLIPVRERGKTKLLSIESEISISNEVMMFDLQVGEPPIDLKDTLTEYKELIERRLFLETSLKKIEKIFDFSFYRPIQTLNSNEMSFTKKLLPNKIQIFSKRKALVISLVTSISLSIIGVTIYRFLIENRSRLRESLKLF